MTTEISIKLTPTDRVILESYKILCEGLSDYLGNSYEIVLHSLENFDNSIIKIINGHYTGRREGMPITDLALHMLKGITETGNSSYISYFTKNKRREPMRSTTIVVRGEAGRAIGVLCINLYLNTPLSCFIENLTEGTANVEMNACLENFADNPFNLISATMEKVRADVQAEATVSAQNRNKEIIHRLSTLGIFRFKDSVTICANLLGLSKNTVYMHLRNDNN